VRECEVGLQENANFFWLQMELFRQEMKTARLNLFFAKQAKHEFHKVELDTLLKIASTNTDMATRLEAKLIETKQEKENEVRVLVMHVRWRAESMLQTKKRH